MTRLQLDQPTVLGLTPERAARQREAGQLEQDSYLGWCFCWHFLTGEPEIRKVLSPEARKTARLILNHALRSDRYADKVRISQGLEALKEQQP